MPELTTFAKEINRAQHQAMKDDQSMLAFGLGMTDPKGIFGTTLGLEASFGAQRVFDMPTAENAMTGIGIGAAISGSRVLMTHQRVDFFLLALDQLVNNAAKWHYMFNGKMNVPLTIRLIVGRGWGQGPTHAQNLQAWFAHVPGLKVVVPSTADVVAAQLYQSLMDDNPTLFIEHRWLHQQQVYQSEVLALDSPLNGTRILREGSHLTLVVNSYMVLEAISVAERLASRRISCEVIDVGYIHTVDFEPIEQSVKKTGALLVCDSATMQNGISAEILATITQRCFDDLQIPPVRLGLPQYPEPTSFGLTKDYYCSADKIAMAIGKLLGVSVGTEGKDPSLHDVPGNWFQGPF